MKEDCPINIVVLGDMGVGKSALLLRFANGTYKPHIPSTIIDTLPAQVIVKNKLVNLTLWDTAGQERFRALVYHYFRRADGVVLVYDVTDNESFSKLSSWAADLKAINQIASVIIVGSKIDESSRKVVSSEAGKAFADNQRADFIEASAKTGENVDEIFHRLALKILLSKESPETFSPLTRKNSELTLHNSNSNRTTDKKEKCC
ncbi:GTP-binding protein yptV1 [Caerostris extrusa]|uniref:GTP-binding protein yptV1 n=1 Tax=Caerostris extrusa TaxID=172846 RepID=A0AAV4X7J3_CAEEX|nr:GTP-binding protein yptV1 [Caerostris extrusa]